MSARASQTARAPRSPAGRDQLAGVIGMDGQPHTGEDGGGVHTGLALAGLVLAGALLGVAWWLRRQARAQQVAAVSAAPAPEWAYDGGPVETVEPAADQHPEGESAADATGQRGEDDSNGAA